MQRKQIKVGEAYAITNQRGRYRDSGSKVKGTVVRLDAEYEHRKYRYSSITMTDGILVRFDEPVLFDHSGPRLLSELVASDNYTQAALRDYKKRAVTEWVATDTRFVYERWDTYEARQKSIQETAERYARESDERAAAFEPVLQETVERLTAAGLKNVKVTDSGNYITFDGGKIPLQGQTGTDGDKRPTQFGYEAKLDIETFLNLLDARVEATV